MGPQKLNPQVICKAFTVALLLSGDMEIAEEVVHEAIGSLDLEDLSTDALLICVTMLSLARSGDKPTSADLPDELRKVFEMPPTPRRCFVLRILLGLPLNVCATLLRTDQKQISKGLNAAYRLLDGQYEYDHIAGSGGGARAGRIDGERSHHA